MKPPTKLYIINAVRPNISYISDSLTCIDDCMSARQWC
jgi:hypothetical protein